FAALPDYGWVRAGGRQVSPAAPRDAAHPATGQSHPVVIDDALPAVPVPDELRLEQRVPLDHRPADDGVEAGAVTAGGQDPDLHGCSGLASSSAGAPASASAPVAGSDCSVSSDCARTSRPPAAARSSVSWKSTPVVERT